MANSNRLLKAFQELELLVTLHILPTETGSLALYMLPCTAPLQRPDLPFIFPLMLGLQAKPYLQATRRVLRPEGEQRDEATIYLDLCRASGVNLFGSAVAQRFFESARGVHRLRQKMRGEGQEQPSLPQEFLLNGLLRLTGQPGFGTVLKHKHGRARPEPTARPDPTARLDHEVGSFLGVELDAGGQNQQRGQTRQRGPIMKWGVFWAWIKPKAASLRPTEKSTWLRLCWCRP